MAAAPSGSIPPPGFQSEPRPGQAPSEFLQEHKAFPIPTHENRSNSLFSFADPILKPLSQSISSIRAAREKLALPHPGTVEHLTREVKATHLTNHFFDGGRADLTKMVNLNPIFQITHGFAYPGQGAPPSYNFGAVYGDDRLFLQGGLDDGGNVTMRGNKAWNYPGHTSKAQGQLAAAGGQSFVQLEHDWQGLDHAANIKMMNPSPADGTGIYLFNYLQSLTRNFAFGLETVYQRPSVDLREANTGYLAKWTSTPRDAIATLQLQPGVAQATYWQRLSDKVDAAVDLQCITAGGRREAQATLGAKWDFRMSTFRAQVDSTGKLSSLLETRLAPTFAFTVGGEIDHPKQAARFGLGISLESASSDIPMDPNAPPPAAPQVPM